MVGALSPCGGYNHSGVSIPERGLGWLERPVAEGLCDQGWVSIPERGLGWLEPSSSAARRAKCTFQSLRGVWGGWSVVKKVDTFLFELFQSLRGVWGGWSEMKIWPNA